MLQPDYYINFKFSGFPKVSILSRPWKDILIFFTLFYSGFLFLILISCIICLLLICKKKRLFQNEVAVIQQPENQQNDQNGSASQVSENEQQLEVQARKEEEEKTMLQILAAERTLKTNGILGIFFAVLFYIILTASKEARVYLQVIISAIIKAALPLLTTIANFGTIQHVVKKYWNYFYPQNTSSTDS